MPTKEYLRKCLREFLEEKTIGMGFRNSLCSFATDLP